MSHYSEFECCIILKHVATNDFCFGFRNGNRLHIVKLVTNRVKVFMGSVLLFLLFCRTLESVNMCPDLNCVKI